MKSYFDKLKFSPKEFYISLKRVPTTGKAFLLVAIAQAIVILIVQIIIIQNPGINPNDKQYATIFFISLCFFLWFAFDGILDENMGMIIAFITDAALVTGVSINAFANDNFFKEGNQNYILAQMIISIICFFTYCGFGWFIYLAFGWKIFMKVGHDKEMRARFKIYKIFITLTKFDIQLGVILVSMAGLFLLSDDPKELYLLIGAMIITFLWAFLGWYGTRKENFSALYVFYLIATVQPAYIIYKIFWMYIYLDRFENIPIRLIITAVVIAMLSRVLLIILNYKCVLNFDKGLHNYIDRDSSFKTSNIINSSINSSVANL